MAVSVVGKAICSYHSTNMETAVGYHMAAEKRVHIGDRLRYIPMGYFNDNSLGNITAVVTTTLGDVENAAARCLVMVIGGFLNTLALCLALTLSDWRVGIIALLGILCYLIVTELSQRAQLRTAPARQHAQMNLVEAVLEYIQGMSVVKSYGLEKDNGQAVQKAVDASCQKALALEKSIVPWSAARQLIVRVFSVGIVLCALLLYTNGAMPLARCLLIWIQHCAGRGRRYSLRRRKAAHFHCQSHAEGRSHHHPGRGYRQRGPGKRGGTAIRHRRADPQ